MDISASTGFWLSLILVLLSAFFVSAEYALVSSKRSRIESLARKKNLGAALLLKELKNLSGLIAACQIGITMIGIAVGALTEPFAATELERIAKGYLDPQLSFAIGFIVVAILLVVLGELAPKYATLAAPERTAIAVLRPLKVIAVIFKPLIVIAEALATFVLKPFGVSLDNIDATGLSNEELLLVIQANGNFSEEISEFIARTIRLSSICARDVMIHRLEVKWMDSELNRNEAMAKLAEIPYGRIPVCQRDVDNIVGILYAQDMFKAMEKNPFVLKDWIRPAVFIPENLSLDRILKTMRESRAQLVVVADEYGGTSGIVTLEDVSEEIFGDLEDTDEKNNQSIQKRGNGIFSARASVRLDELGAFIGVDEQEISTKSLASIIVEKLNRVPLRGDEVEFDWGHLRVMSVHRRHIQQVEVRLSRDLANIGPKADK